MLTIYLPSLTWRSRRGGRERSARWRCWAFSLWSRWWWPLFSPGWDPTSPWHAGSSPPSEKTFHQLLQIWQPFFAVLRIRWYRTGLAYPGGSKTYGSDTNIYIILQRSQKTVEIKVFPIIFAWWWKDPALDPDADPGGPKIYGSHGSVCESESATLLFWDDKI